MDIRAALSELDQTLVQPWLVPLRPGRVAMFHIGRSGSTVLGGLLAQHPGIFWDREIYEREFREWQTRHGRFKVGDPQPALDPIRHLQQRVSRGGRRWYGFEVKFFHLEHAQLPLATYVTQLREVGVTRFLVLRRKNYLRKIVSSMIASTTRQWHVGRGGEARKATITIDPARVPIDRNDRSLLQLLESYERGFRGLQALLRPGEVLHLTYEDDVQTDPAQAYAKSVAFLGLEPRPVKTQLGRTNPYPLRQLVENFDDVERALAGTPFEWMTREGEEC